MFMPETCDLAAPYGISIDLEFPSFSRLRTLDDVLDIVRTADRPNAGILVDTLYLHLSRVDLGELLLYVTPSGFISCIFLTVCPGLQTRARE